MPERSLPRRAVPLLALALSGAVAVAEFLRNPNLRTLPWSDIGLRRLATYAVVFAALALLRRPLARIRWLPSPGIWTYFTALALVYGMAAIGVGPFAATALCAVSAVAVGSLILGDQWKDRAGEIALCLCLGEGLLGFAAALLGHTYLCYRVTFLVLLLAPLVVQRRWLAARAVRVWTRLRTDDYPAGTEVVITLMCFVAGMQFLLAMKPEVGTDSLAMHLALPAYVSMHHHWPYDVKEFIWAVMPQTTDWCYTLAFSMGGEFAARLLNFANLLAILGLLYAFARSCCSRLAALSICALYATGPLVQVVTGSLFIENLLAALLLASAMAFCAHLREGGTRLFAAGWLLLGLALSAKSGAIAFAPGLMALAVYAAWKRPVRSRAWPLAVASGVAIGVYFYVLAWLRTGNPFFPAANEIFHSPLFPGERIANQFRRPLSWHVWTDITFHSGDYIEGTDGCAGFQYFLLLPAALAVACWRRHRAMVWAAAVGLSAFVLTFGELSYLRYLYPALAVLMAPVALWLDEQRRGAPLQKWTAFGAVALAGVANILFLPSAGWYHRDFVWNQAWDRGAGAEYLAASAPARSMVEVLNRIAPGEPALFCEYDLIAGLAGPAYSTNWHTYHRNGGLLNMREGADVLAFLNERHIRYIASPFSEDLDTWPRVLPAFFDDFAEPVFSSGRWVLYRLQRAFTGAAGTEAARRLVEDPPAAEPGDYDDADMRVVRQGRGWYRDFARGEPRYHTMTESGTAGDELRFSFRGTGITYVFARDPAFGIAEILIDGQTAATIDEYAGRAAYGERQVFEGLAPGLHTLAVRVTGRKNEASRGAIVGLDALTVSK